jgi:hypothetical protein
MPNIKCFVKNEEDSPLCPCKCFVYAEEKTQLPMIFFVHDERKKPIPIKSSFITKENPAHPQKHRSYRTFYANSSSQMFPGDPTKWFVSNEASIRQTCNKR